jgi:hypothetical protein
MGVGLVTLGIDIAFSRIWDFDWSAGFLVRDAAPVFASAIAAGAHVRGRHPDHTLARWLCGAGGLALLACLAYFAANDGQLWRTESPGTPLLLYLAYAGAAAFALLGMLSFGRNALGTARRTRVLARWGLGFWLPVQALISYAVLLDWQREFAGKSEVILQLKSDGATLGLIVALAAGLAAWMESRETRRAAVPPIEAVFN